MDIEFRKCDYNDVNFILKLKELCMKWYIEKIYGWNIDIQREKTKHELDKHINDMRVIIVDNKDAGLTTFYKENDKYVVGLIMINPTLQGKGIGSKIINDYIDIAKKENTDIYIKTYKLNPAKELYKRLGFIQYDEDDTHVYLKIEF